MNLNERVRFNPNSQCGISKADHKTINEWDPIYLYKLATNLAKCQISACCEIELDS